MRRRIALMCAVVVLALVALPLGSAAVASATPRNVVLAQAGGGGDTEQGESGDSGGKGQSDSKAETGASNSSETAEEEGPPWTYQMARIGIGLLVLMALGLGLLYYRMVVSRQRGA